MGNIIDLTDKKVGRLTIKTICDERTKNGRFIMNCQCDCGNFVKIRRASLLSGHTKSCGCLKKENIVHGLSKGRLYNAWKSMRARCNKNYMYHVRYYDRGIVVCHEWNNYLAFYNWSMSNGYDKDLSLDRKNNDLGYYPENCRWTTMIKQANNRGNTLLFYKGKEQTKAEWERELGIARGVIQQRIDMGKGDDFIFHKGSHRNELNIKKRIPRSRLSRIWCGIRQRCRPKQQASKNYSDRGIKVCDEWQEKKNFVEWAHANGYTDNLTIDRKDVNGDYCPENCRWITQKEQCRNKRNNRILTYNNQSHCLTEWAELLEITSSTLRGRISRNLSEDRIFHRGTLKNF